MALARSSTFLLASLSLFLGLSLDMVETASERRRLIFRNMPEVYDGQSPSRGEKTLFFLKSVGSKSASPARSKRATESCRSGPITASTLEDPLFVVRYDSVEQFDACLGNEVLKASLAPLLDQPLPDDYLAVIKRKLDEIYPDGIPDDQLKVLSYLSRSYSPEEIRKWRVTTNDTLATLLSPESGAWKPDQLNQLISRYMELGGKLTGPLLKALGGGNLCLLEADRLKQIDPESIRLAGKLDVSSCSQDKKNILYGLQGGVMAPSPSSSPEVRGTTADSPEVRGTASLTLPPVASAMSAVSVAAISNASTTTFSSVLLEAATDFHTAPLFRVTPAADKTSPLAEATSNTVVGTRSEAPVPAADVTAAAEGSTSRSPVPATATDTAMAAPVTTAASCGITTNGTSLEVAQGVNTTASVSTIAVSTNVTTDGAVLPTIATPINATTSFNTTLASNNVTTDETAVASLATQVNTTTSVSTTAASTVTASGTVVPTIATDISATTSVNTKVASTNVTADGTVVPTLATPVNATTSVNTTVASTVTTDGTVVPTVATRVNTTTSVNTTVAFTSITADGRILPTVATKVNVTSTPDAPISHKPTLSINHPSATPRTTVTTSSEWPPAPPVPLPNATAPVSPSTPPVTRTPAASSRTTVPSPETPHETAVSAVRPHTPIVGTPQRGTTGRAPPKTKQPSYPTPDGYINVKPLSASASSLSPSCPLLTPPVAVGLLVLRRLF